MKKFVFKIFAAVTGKQLQLQHLMPAALLKETLTQLFSCEYCQSFKSINFQENLRTAASGSK